MKGKLVLSQMKIKTLLVVDPCPIPAFSRICPSSVSRMTASGILAQYVMVVGRNAKYVHLLANPITLEMELSLEILRLVG